MFTSTHLKAIIKEARPIIERQLDDAVVIAGIRTKVTNDGGDWGQVKALLKAMIQDERDESGEGKRIAALLGKAEHATAYADMLGIGNLNEKNSFAASETPAADDGEGTAAPGSLANTNSAIEHHVPNGAGTDDQGGIGEGGAPAALANPIQPSESTATQSHADVRVVGTATSPAGAEGDEDRQPNSEPDDGQGGALGFEPGSIRYENTPPVGIVRHEVQRCFPEPLGRNVKLLDDIRANGVREPILMQGNILLDGWSRFLAARELHIDYPVKEYDGTDPLADIIKLNMASRSLNLAERVSIGRKLIKLAPEREGDIVELLDLDQQREAAQ